MLTDNNVQPNEQFNEQPDVHSVVLDSVTTLLREVNDDEEVARVDPASALPDLGIDSLLLARLIIELEDAFAVRPFEDEEASIGDLRTLADLAKVFEDARSRA